LGSVVFDTAGGVSRIGAAGAAVGCGGGVVGFREPFTIRVWTGFRVVERVGVVPEGVGRVDPDVLRAVLGGAASRVGEVFAGRDEGVGFFPAVVRGDRVAWGACAAALRGVADAFGTAVFEEERADPGRATTARVGFWGAAVVVARDFVVLGAGGSPTRERGGFRDGFPGDFGVLEREGRGFWGISAELEIRQASRWGSGGVRVDPPR
jgi:hypothetical protein